MKMKSDGWPSIVATYGCNLLAITAVLRMIPLKADIESRTGATDGQFGWLIGLSGLVPTLLASVAGIIVTRIGAQRMLLSGAMIVAITSVGYLVAETFAQFTAIRLLEGVALVALFTGGPVMNMQIPDRRRQGVAMSVWSTGQPIGAFLAFQIGGLFAGKSYWRESFLVTGILALALAVAAYLMPRADALATLPQRSLRELLHGLRQRGPLRLSIFFFALTSSQIGTHTVVASYLVDAHQLPIGTAVRLVGEANLMVIPGALLMGALLQSGVSRFRLCMILTSGASGFGSLIFLPASPVVVVVLALGGWFLTLGAISALMWNTLPTVSVPSYRGHAAGVMSQVSALAFLITPSLWLALLDSWGWLAIVTLILFLWINATAMFLSLKRDAMG